MRKQLFFWRWSPKKLGAALAVSVLLTLVGEAALWHFYGWAGAPGKDPLLFWAPALVMWPFAAVVAHRAAPPATTEEDVFAGIGLGFVAITIWPLTALGVLVIVVGVLWSTCKSSGGGQKPRRHLYLDRDEKDGRPSSGLKFQSLPQPGP